MKARRVAGLGLACIALISISTPASAASASASSGSPSELLFSTANVEEVAGLIQSEPSVFAGAYLDRSGGLHIQAVSAGEQSALSQLKAIAAKISTRPKTVHGWLTTVQYSLADLQAALSKVSPNAPSYGPFLAEWGVDGARDRVRVALTTITPSIRAALQGILGSEAEIVSAQRPVAAVGIARPSRLHTGTISPAVSTPPPFPSRYDDISPFYGGDSIIANLSNGNVIYCTTAFALTNGDMLTAGHCNDPGLVGDWHSGYYQGGVAYMFADEGSPQNTTFTNGQPDVGTLGGPLSSFVNDVYYNNTSAAESMSGPVSGLLAGQPICADGAVTSNATGGEDCGATISYTNQCVTVTDDASTGTRTVNECGEAIADSSDGTAIVRPGDSGGPVFIGSNPTEAQGIISAESNNGAELDFTQIGNALSAVGSSMKS